MPGKTRMTEELADRIAYTGELMTRLRSSYRVELEASKHFGVTRRAVRKWMAKVREMRREESSGIDRLMARDDMRAAFNLAGALAIGRTQVVKDKDGNPVMEEVFDPRANQVVKRVAMRPNPDIQRFLHAMRELVHLDGLAEEAPSAPIKVEVEQARIPELSKLPPAVAAKAAAAMQAYVAALSPDGKLDSVAGEWFRMAGDPPVTTLTGTPKTETTAPAEAPKTEPPEAS
jgi:hypothetical protein